MKKRILFVLLIFILILGSVGIYKMRTSQPSPTTIQEAEYDHAKEFVSQDTPSKEADKNEETYTEPLKQEPENTSSIPVTIISGIGTAENSQQNRTPIQPQSTVEQTVQNSPTNTQEETIPVPEINNGNNTITTPGQVTPLPNQEEETPTVCIQPGELIHGENGDELSVVIAVSGLQEEVQAQLELLTEQAEHLEPAVITSVAVSQGETNAVLAIPESVPNGIYILQLSIGEDTTQLPIEIIHSKMISLEEMTTDLSQAYAGEEISISVNVVTKDIEDGQNIEFIFLDTERNAIITATAEVQANTASGILVLPSDIAVGNYIIQVRYQELTKESIFEILPKPVPEVLSVTANKTQISYGYEENLYLSVQLKDIPDESSLTLSLLDENGVLLEGQEIVVIQIQDNRAETDFHVNPLQSGTYLIRVAYSDEVYKDISLSVTNGDAGWKDILDYSQKDDQLYWFDEYNHPYAYTEENAPFDRTKPTIIFIHGWQNGDVAKNNANDYNYVITDRNKNVVSFNSAKAWVDAGYNVGVYNWVQIADEPGEGFWGVTPYSAEAKVWTTNYTSRNKPMRYRLSDGTFIYETEKTAPELFVEKYLDAMKGYQGDYIEFGGHSLGNQMVLRAAELILEATEIGTADKALVPDHITLMEPYYSGNSDKYASYRDETKLTAAKAAVKIASGLVQRNVVLQMFKSSELTTISWAGDVNKDLENLAAYNRMNPNVFNFTDQAAAHSSAYEFYYWAKASGNEYYIKTDTNVASLMGSYFREEQITGTDTVDPSDDKGKIIGTGTYVPVEDIILTGPNGEDLGAADSAETAETITVHVGEYIKLNAKVNPLNATAKVVVFEKADGDRYAAQLAYDGYIKGLKVGELVLKATVLKRDAAGNSQGYIERYVIVKVEE